jgi:hypothetical protein
VWKQQLWWALVWVPRSIVQCDFHGRPVGMQVCVISLDELSVSETGLEINVITYVRSRCRSTKYCLAWT